MALHRTAEEFGLPVPAVRIDHYEDICQANGVAPTMKYESDGGPGIATIMELLKSSQKPEEDRKQCMKTIFLFWLLGAIDGHAKNFSILLKAVGWAYRELFRNGLSTAELHEIREAPNQELVLGREHFKDKIEKMTRRQSRPGKPGRPRVEESRFYYLY